MAKTMRAYRMTEKLLQRNSIPSYNDLADNVAQITPVKIRNIGSWHYHVAEDVKGQVYLIEDDVVMQNKLYERNMGVSESKFMLDGVGINQIKEFKAKQEETLSGISSIQRENPKSALRVEKKPVKLSKNLSPELIKSSELKNLNKPVILKEETKEDQGE